MDLIEKWEAYVQPVFWTFIMAFSKKFRIPSMNCMMAFLQGKNTGQAPLQRLYPFGVGIHGPLNLSVTHNNCMWNAGPDVKDQRKSQRNYKDLLNICGRICSNQDRNNGKLILAAFRGFSCIRCSPVLHNPFHQFAKGFCIYHQVQLLSPAFYPTILWNYHDGDTEQGKRG